MSKTKHKSLHLTLTDPIALQSLGAGVEAPAEFSARFEDPSLPCVVTLDVVLRDGRYKVVRLVAQDGDITGEVLRQLPVGDLLRRAALAAAARTSMSWPAASADLAKLSDAHLEMVAATYRFAVLLGESATQEVAERFDVSRATAGRWIAEARKRRVLGTPPRNRAGERRPPRQGRATKGDS